MQTAHHPIVPTINDPGGEMALCQRILTKCPRVFFVAQPDLLCIPALDLAILLV